MAEIRIEHLSKDFGDQTAVRDLTLTIGDGEFLTLLGPSGCGKTTTLRCIAGLENQSDGDVRIGGRVVNTLPPAKRDVAMVFQMYALYPHLSVYENIAFPLRTQKVGKAETERRVRQAASLLGIERLLDRRPAQLSGGEQQRVALGRAIVRQPQAFLMDEPLTSLDPRLRSAMRVEIKRLQRTLGTTVVYVTHDQTEALSMSQRIAIMNRGALEQVGSPTEIYNRPATLFIAGFVGAPPMNMLECGLEDGERPVLRDRLGRFCYELSPPQAHRLRTHHGADRLVFGVRPEDVDLERGTERDGLPSRIVGRELLGDGGVYDLAVGEKTFRARTPPALRLDVGEPVRLRFDPARVHAYDGVTGRIIF